MPFGVKFKSRRDKQKQKALHKDLNHHENKRSSQTTRNILILFAIMVIISQGQQALGIGIHYISEKIGMLTNAYPSFGTEIGGGFSGGHGTAGVIGSMLQSMNQPYWETAQGVTVTTATFGIIGGILIGIVLINFAARRGYTQYLSSSKSFPKDMKQGYQPDIAKQNKFGKETTLSSSVDTLAFHIALILGGSGVAYGVLTLVQYFNVPIIGNVPIWAYAILVMYLIWWVMCQLNISWIVDSQVASKIASMFTDFAVVAAIVSMPVQAVLSYFVPILIMVILIGAFTILAAYFLCKKYFKDFWFEKSVAVLGTSTGVFISGLLLLKMCDPEYKSPVLTEYSVGYSANSVLGFIMMPFMFGLLINQGLLTGFSLIAGVVILAIILLLIVKKPKNSTMNEEMNVS